MKNSDVYQIVAYQKLHSTVQSAASALVYPQTGVPICRKYSLTGQNEGFYVFTVNVSRNLKEEESFFVNEVGASIHSIVNDNNSHQKGT